LTADRSEGALRGPFAVPAGGSLTGVSEMTVLIQVRAPHSSEGQALIERIQSTLPPRMQSVTGSLPDGREAGAFVNVLLMRFRAPSNMSEQTRELAIDYFRTDPRRMSVNYASLAPATGTFEVTAYSPDAPPDDVVLQRGDRDALDWWDMIASTTDPVVARYLIGERPGE